MKINIARGFNSYYHGHSRLREDGLIFLPFHIIQWIMVTFVMLFVWFWFLMIAWALLSAFFEGVPRVYQCLVFFGITCATWLYEKVHR